MLVTPGVTSWSFCLCYVGKCIRWGCYYSGQARGACNCQLWGFASPRDRKLWESHNFLLSHCDGPRIIYFLWQPVSSTLTSCTIFLERIQVFSFFQGLLFRLSHFLHRKYAKLTHHPYVRFQSHVVSIYEKCVNSRQLSRFVSSPLINLTIWQEQAAKATPKIKKIHPTARLQILNLCQIKFTRRAILNYFCKQHTPIRLFILFMIFDTELQIPNLFQIQIYLRERVDGLTISEFH